MDRPNAFRSGFDDEHVTGFEFDRSLTFDSDGAAAGE
jgi:hypothetical protein